MSTLWSNGEFEISAEPFGGRSSLPGGGRVAVNDPRIPPPAPDMIVWTEPGAAPLLNPQGEPLATPQSVKGSEDDMPKKIGIFATRGDDFAVSVLDDANDPVDGGSQKFTATEIVQKVKPLLEAAGHKVVDNTFGSLHEAASEGKVKPIRRRASSE